VLPTPRVLCRRCEDLKPDDAAKSHNTNVFKRSNDVFEPPANLLGDASTPAGAAEQYIQFRDYLNHWTLSGEERQGEQGEEDKGAANDDGEGEAIAEAADADADTVESPSEKPNFSASRGAARARRPKPNPSLRGGEAPRRRRSAARNSTTKTMPNKASLPLYYTRLLGDPPFCYRSLPFLPNHHPICKYADFARLLFLLARIHPTYLIQ
jgi:hypothetical protein